jgi:hypothetical protein
VANHSPFQEPLEITESGRKKVLAYSLTLVGE